ncbi:MAG: ATP-binding protein [Anaerolineae bacterium]
MSLKITDREDLSTPQESLAGITPSHSHTSGFEATQQSVDSLLRVAIEQTTEGVIITDVQGTITYVNPAFESMSGYQKFEVIGRTPRMLQSGEHDAAFYRQLWETISAGKVWRGRFVNRRRDGTRYVVDATITPVRDADGHITHYVSLQRDVTREVQLEEQYHQSQKMEILGQLTAGIAHDFNNVLTAVNGYAELMQAQLSSDHPAHDMVLKLLRAGQRGADLARQLLVFSRKQANRPQVLNLNALIIEMEVMLQRAIGEHIQLSTRLAQDLWLIKADPAQIEQVIVNLVVNARDAMPHGGRLSIETTNVVLDEHYVSTYLEARPGDYVALTVNDTGVGMTPEVKLHLFEPFFTTKGRGKGTGLGLATVYSIVKQHGGSIWVYSEPGVGTTFKIYLPRLQEEGQFTARDEVAEHMCSGRETILLVEDDPSVCDLTELILRRHGYTVLSAENGGEALRLAKEHPGKIDLLLSDIVLPDLSAVTLTEQLKRFYPRLKTLYMSGYGSEVIARYIPALRHITLLQKPFSSADLARQVRNVLDTPAASEVWNGLSVPARTLVHPSKKSDGHPPWHRPPRSPLLPGMLRPPLK